MISTCIISFSGRFIVLVLWRSVHIILPLLTIFVGFVGIRLSIRPRLVRDVLCIYLPDPAQPLPCPYSTSPLFSSTWQTILSSVPLLIRVGCGGILNIICGGFVIRGACLRAVGIFTIREGVCASRASGVRILWLSDGCFSWLGCWRLFRSFS